MDIYPDSLGYAAFNATLDVDLSAATADVFLANAWHALSWTGASVQSGSNWVRPCNILVSGVNQATGVKPTTADTVPLLRILVNGAEVVKPSNKKFSVKRS